MTAKGFVLLPRRWVVERSHSWTLRARRNVRAYETLPSHIVAMANWAAVTLMTRRLATPKATASRTRPSWTKKTS